MLLAFGRKKSPSNSHPIGVEGWLRRASSVAVNRGRDTTWIPRARERQRGKSVFSRRFGFGTRTHMSSDGTLMKTRFLRSRPVRLLAFWALCILPVAAPAAQETNPDTLPMFGQPAITRPDDLKKADEVFIKNAVAKHGNRTAASIAALAQGWASIRSGKSALALRYFNEGWLLAPDNPGVFWGFGAVLSERGKFLEAIEQLETARELMINDAKQLAQLLADIGAVRSAYAVSLPRERELERAAIQRRQPAIFRKPGARSRLCAELA